METLGDALPLEMARVRDEVLPAYLACGKAGMLAATMMRQNLDQAARAMARGDLPEMIRAYQLLKEYQV